MDSTNRAGDFRDQPSAESRADCREPERSNGDCVASLCNGADAIRAHRSGNFSSRYYQADNRANYSCRDGEDYCRTRHCTASTICAS